MKPVDVKSSTNTDSNKEINNKDPKFKIADFVRIWKYKNIFAKLYPSGTQCPEDVPLSSYFGRDVPDDNSTKIGLLGF